METKAKIKKKIIRIVLTLTAILLLKGLFAWSNQCCDFYFHRWYAWSSWTLRQVTGIVPFSVGDVIYTAWVIAGIVYLLKLCYNLIRLAWERILLLILSGISFLSACYLAFLVLWGFNYDRYSIPYETGVVSGDYNTRQLYQLTDTLLQLVNKEKYNTGDTVGIMTPDTTGTPLFKQAIAAYAAAAEKWPALRYKAPCVKPSLFGEWMNYAGTTGYLNPFTNEAQVNTTVPAVLQPFITCHEIAHQLGYAPEEDANFIGYLAATSIADSRFRYSAHFDMFLYSVRQLGYQDSTLAKTLWKRTLPGVKADHKAMIDFYERYTSKADKYFTLFYDSYLKANKQEKGIRSYSEVTGWLVAYFKIKP
ncbi:DUF3810 domain-containing protein [Chitinophaga nivalis]|uniref:DUF3810 domain-containing protein n=1 Tax=Chitinophaga nivalis TaxID=2991709 RepID=A0ABT3IQ14_9BACT|nr:DUF3810 domain-containing protein [Chitinophaga nivalis]MCW3464259.1 DUF3810 domain-containing protein [Chitinophaga nivalis]MCW3486050.1 DUF3810 domain-containing protein [Chitinophaga nivalis]